MSHSKSLVRGKWERNHEFTIRRRRRRRRRRNRASSTTNLCRYWEKKPSSKALCASEMLPLLPLLPLRSSSSCGFLSWALPHPRCYTLLRPAVARSHLHSSSSSSSQVESLTSRQASQVSIYIDTLLEWNQVMMMNQTCCFCYLRMEPFCSFHLLEEANTSSWDEVIEVVTCPMALQNKTKWQVRTNNYKCWE